MTRENVDRTLFELLRKGVVAAGYLPDVSLFAGNPNGYKAAKLALQNSLPDKQLIEVFGVGSAEARDEKIVNKIVINRKREKQGTMGGFPSMRFTEYKNGLGQNRFKKEFLPAYCKDVEYEIRFITNSTKYERVLSNIMDTVLGLRAYSKIYDNTGAQIPDEEILIEQTGDLDVSSTKLVERLFMYTVPDVWLQENKLIQDNIVPMTTVSLGVTPEPAITPDTTIEIVS